MKNKIKLTLIIISLAILFPIKVFASDFTTSLGGNKTINANESFSVTLKVSNANNLMTFDTVLTYDKSKLELVGYSGQSGFTVSVSSAIAGYGSPKSGDFSLVTLNFKAKGDFTPGQNASISISSVTAADGDANEMTGLGTSIDVYVAIPKSTNNNLSNLTVNGSTVSGFSSSNTNYTLPNTDDTSINIDGVLEDSKASISGTGSKNLQYGKNTFTITVTSENGSKKTYTINVTRNDKRSTNNNLSSLTISPAKIDFSKDKKSYTVIVENNIASINIVAKTEDSKSSVSGTGNKSLKVYSNVFNVVVTAENGSKKTYTLNVVRKDENGNKGALSTNNNLESLVVSGYDIKFDKDTTNYSITVLNEVDSVKVDAKVADSKSTIEIDNKPLQVGDNVISITVTSESGDIKVYKINVTRRNDSPSTTLEKLESIIGTTTSSTIEVNIKDDNNEVSSKVIKLLKDKNITLIVNKYGDEKLLYTWTINSKELDENSSFDTLVKFTTDNKNDIDSLTNYSESINLSYLYNGKLPKDTKFKVFVGDKYEDDTELNLYLYKDSKLNDAKKALLVKNGYVEYNISDGGEYILTKASFDEKINIFLIISIIELVVIVVLLFLVIRKNIKK